MVADIFQSVSIQREKEKIIRYFCIENFRSLDGFMTRKRKELNIQNKQTDRWKGKYLYLAAKQVPTT